MRFRDNKLWSVWPLLPIFVTASLFMIYEMCRDIASRPLQWKDAYAVVVGLTLLCQIMVGVLIWSAFHALSVYEINEEGFRCRTFPRKQWTKVPWSEFTFGGLYSRWTGETEDFVCFSNYWFDGAHTRSRMNDGDVQFAMFTIPLTKRGLKAIRAYVPDEQLRLLANSPWLWKSRYVKALNTIFAERGLLCAEKSMMRANGAGDDADGGANR
jgi:hypothetical protein